ncbi:MAG: HINT domain-containing protein [Gemmataceae bacterium]|nr:HINT domain-containing protein [Gemmataceae bacterium]
MFGLAGIDAGPYLSIFRTDTSSAGYQAGQVVGQIVQIAITLNPGTAFAAAIFPLQMVGNAINAAEAAWNGDFRGAMGLLLSAAMSASRWLPPCITKSGVAQALGPALGKTVELAQRGMLLYGVASGVERGIDQMMSGNILQGLLSIGQSAADAYSMTRSCFTGETKLMARGSWGCGYRRIDELTDDDEVLSRPEDNPNGPLAWKKVEQKFIRYAQILHVHVGSHVIRTTAEHPFWVKDFGWKPAGELKAGDLLATDNGQWVAVEETFDTGEFETVYNLRVAEWHTYFVGDSGWLFCIWAHNDYLTEEGVLVGGPNPNKLRQRVVSTPTAGEGGVYLKPHDGKTKVGSAADFRARYGAKAPDGIEVEIRQTRSSKPAGVDDREYPWTPRRQRRFDEEYVDRMTPPDVRYRDPNNPLPPVSQDKWVRFRHIFGYGDVPASFGA